MSKVQLTFVLLKNKKCTKSKQETNKLMRYKYMTGTYTFARLISTSLSCCNIASSRGSQPKNKTKNGA